MTAPSPQRLIEALDYDPETGVFTWRRDTANIKAGAVAGCISKAQGYVLIRLDGSLMLAHRAAWAWMMGEWPVKKVDHRNRRKADNSWDNLRLADASENGQNRLGAQSNNKTGCRNVCYIERLSKPWWAKVNHRGTFEQGFFDTLLDAAAFAASRRAAMQPFSPEADFTAEPLASASGPLLPC